MDNGYADDLALATAIMSSYDPYFMKMKLKLHIFGFAAYEKVIIIANEFVKATRLTNWDKFMEDPTQYGFPKEITDYEESCIYFYDNYLDTNKI